ALDRHRKTHLEKGPDLDVGKEDETSGVTGKRKGKAMKTVSKKDKTADKKTSKKSSIGALFSTKAAILSIQGSAWMSHDIRARIESVLVKLPNSSNEKSSLFSPSSGFGLARNSFSSEPYVRRKA
ncbi:hypothetical protein LCGC14_2957670, partial [marine sediment metagenome]